MGDSHILGCRVRTLFHAGGCGVSTTVFGLGIPVNLAMTLIFYGPGKTNSLAFIEGVRERMKEWITHSGAT